VFVRSVTRPIFAILLAVWAAPSMTIGHLLFSVAITGYILISIQIGEHDLIQQSVTDIAATASRRPRSSFRAASSSIGRGRLSQSRVQVRHSPIRCYGRNRPLTEICSSLIATAPDSVPTSAARSTADISPFICDVRKVPRTVMRTKTSDFG
jgi:hypothetical protein